MNVMLVFGDVDICDRVDLENLSWKKFEDFEALDKYLASIRKGDGKFQVVGIDEFMDDWNDYYDDMKSYRQGDTFMGYAKIG